MALLSPTGSLLREYQTGDRPVLLLCSDGYHYICKYKQPGGAANKLVNEWIGSRFASAWGIMTPSVSLIANDPVIWDGSWISHDPIAPLLGSRKMENVFDLNEINCDQVEVSESTLNQILRIALFDLWLANEDRTCNNYNLLYDLNRNTIVSIDYAGIFNSGVLNRPLSQIDESDSIISSGLFTLLKKSYSLDVLGRVANLAPELIRRCRAISSIILEYIPHEWNIDLVAVKSKMNELTEYMWIQETIANFVNMVNNAIV